RGFSRPPGSPRLSTRLRRIKELEVSRAGVITVVGGGAAGPAEREEPVTIAEPLARAPESAPVDAEAEEPSEAAEPVDEAESVDEASAPGDHAGQGENEAPDPRNREGAHLQTAT